ncbi:hypothetical protein [Rhizobium sp. SL86]|uniref:hypothetical protein n=1 Tax=Rhizobium sp. SL86 TaxID=2995148 RepID=UPI0022765A18|nr:hypothetical protein [Rhizobium sp. SL86]MCY1668133.1 hypothetical protein [Rhizobium sp. SL86]
MKQMMTGLALVCAALTTLAISHANAIDWGNAGKGDAQKSQAFKPPSAHPPQEATKPDLPDSGFDCDTVTRMSWERPGAERDRRSGPEQVRRCSRDGFSFEVTPPSN